MQSSIQRIGVVGLGHMGSDFASNLIADGYQLTVYDRDEKHAAPLVAKGATAAASMADLASCEIVLTSLPDDDALADATLRDGGLIHALARRHPCLNEDGKPGFVAPLGATTQTKPGRATWRLPCLAIPILRKHENYS